MLFISYKCKKEKIYIYVAYEIICLLVQGNGQSRCLKSPLGDERGNVKAGDCYFTHSISYTGSAAQGPKQP